MVTKLKVQKALSQLNSLKFPVPMAKALGASLMPMSRSIVSVHSDSSHTKGRVAVDSHSIGSATRRATAARTSR